VADGLVLAKIRAAFGGRVKAALSGGAPLSPELNWFFHSVGIPIQEGYGLTETSPAIGVGDYHPCENRIGAVGKPLPNVQIKLAADGELLVRGPSVFSGYWKNAEATAEVFDDEGYFRTGDIAHLDEDGFLFITDRKKDLIIPAGGKNVAPQPIENELKTWPFVDNAVLVGDRMPYITALISPSEEELQVWAEGKGLGGMDLAELLREPFVRQAFKEAVATVNSNLGHFEQIKKYRVLPRSLSLEDGYLTPTLKVKRREVERDFAELIAEMYGSR
jgi:long-chain acyl-CoA synthetase